MYSVKMACAFETGISHKDVSMPCQDYAAYRTTGDVSVLTLSDGAGSSLHAEEAARKTVEWLLDDIPEHFDEIYEDGDSLVSRGQAALMELGYSMKDCYCTMLFFAVHQDGRWLCGHIGDGLIFLSTDEETTILSQPENGAYANQTYFLSEPWASDHLRLQEGRVDGSLSVLMTSDGCGDALHNWETLEPAPAVSRICRRLSTHSAEEVEAALHEDLRERFSTRSEDDLSIALMYIHQTDRVGGGD